VSCRNNAFATPHYSRNKHKSALYVSVQTRKLCAVMITRNISNTTWMTDEQRTVLTMRGP